MGDADELRGVASRLPAPSSVVSYAQNLEDFRLWRALAAVDRGCYVDIGAGHPYDMSVTRLFYERGWRGVNVEPGVGYTELVIDRPEDFNEPVAIGLTAGRVKLTIPVRGTGLATTKAFAGSIDPSLLEAVEERDVEMKRLDVLLKQVGISSDIQFLKVDVEGGEFDVLASNNWELYRPWILVIEVTQPMVREIGERAWAPLIESCGYRFAYFDGLNDFFVRQDHWADLAPLLAYPIGPQDGVSRHVDLVRDAEVGRLHHAAQSLQGLVRSLEDQLQAVQYSRDVVEGQLLSEAVILGDELFVARSEIDVLQSRPGRFVYIRRVAHRIRHPR